MKHAEAGIFLKAGLAIREGGRFRYIFEDSGHDGLVAHLEITDVSKKMKVFLLAVLLVMEL